MGRGPGKRAARPAVERRRPPRALVRVVNPLVRRLVARGAAGGTLLVLHYRGRRTGRSFDVPVGYHVLDGVVTVLTDSGWRRNFVAPTAVEVTLRGQRRPFRASLRDDVDEVTQVYEDLIGRWGVRAAERRLGVRVNVDRPPTRGELADAVRRTGLSLVRLEPLPAPA